MTIAEASRRTGKSESAIRRAIKSGRLKAKLTNGKYDITEKSLKVYVARKEKAHTHKRDRKEGIKGVIEAILDVLDGFDTD